MRDHLGLIMTFTLATLGGCGSASVHPDNHGSDGSGDDSGVAVADFTAEQPGAQPGDLSGPSGFVHPGVLVDRAQLDFAKAKVAAGAEPWKSAFDQANASPLAAAGYTPHPIAVVQCGPFSNPDVGCTDEKNDAAAAYTHALLWYLTGAPAHAQKAIEIMNAWSSVLTAHQLSNAPLQSAWVGSVFPRAAEIIRHTYDGWSAAEIARFASMLRKVYLPQVIGGSASNGNWELSMIEASTAIAVFLDDESTFATAVGMWKKRVPAYLYLSSDGPTPVPPPTGSKTGAALDAFWYSPARYQDGLAQETCRDLGHVQYGLAAMTNAAETARIQGVDLYSLEARRISTAYEFHALYLNGGGANPNAVCGVPLNAVKADPMWEIGYNEYAKRLAMALPNTQRLLTAIRPTGSDHHMQWESLTHAETGSVGIR